MDVNVNAVGIRDVGKGGGSRDGGGGGGSREG